MELPNYRMPGAKNVCQLLWEKAKDFLQKAFTVILIATMLIWFLQSFDIHFNMVTDSKDSMLAVISSIIVPVFKPLGLGDWRICTSLISGLMAKESVVSTLEILFWRNGYDSTHNTFSRISSGVLAALQPMRGCYSIHKERAGCKVGSQCGAFAVCDCMGGSIYCKNYWTACDVKKLTE